MYVCLCNAVTEREIKQAISDGINTFEGLQNQLGVATCCGCCAEVACSYLPEPQRSEAILPKINQVA